MRGWDALNWNLIERRIDDGQKEKRVDKDGMPSRDNEPWDRFVSFLKVFFCCCSVLAYVIFNFPTFRILAEECEFNFNFHFLCRQLLSNLDIKKTQEVSTRRRPPQKPKNNQSNTAHVTLIMNFFLHSLPQHWNSLIQLFPRLLHSIDCSLSHSSNFGQR